MSQEPNPEEQPNLLTNPEALEITISMFENQINASIGVKTKMQEQINQIDESIRVLQDRLKILRSYKEFQDLKGFQIMKQEVEAHQDEIREAQKDRLKDKSVDELLRDFSNMSGSTQSNSNFKFDF